MLKRFWDKALAGLDAVWQRRGAQRVFTIVGMSALFVSVCTTQAFADRPAVDADTTSSEGSMWWRIADRVHLNAYYVLPKEFDSYTGIIGVTPISLQAEPDDTVRYIFRTCNAGYQPIKEAIVSEHQWSTGTLRYLQWWGYQSTLASEQGSSWRMESVSLGLFRLVYQPSEVGLLHGHCTQADVTFGVKGTSDYAWILGSVAGTYRSYRFDIGIAEVGTGSAGT